MWQLRVFSLLVYVVTLIHVYSEVITEKEVPRSGPFIITFKIDTAESKVEWFKDDVFFHISEIGSSVTECKTGLTIPEGFNFYCEDSGQTYKIEILDITEYYNVRFKAQYASGGFDAYTVLRPDPPTTTDKDCYTCNVLIPTIAVIIVLAVIAAVLLILHVMISGEMCRIIIDSISGVKCSIIIDLTLGFLNGALLATAIICIFFVAKGKGCYNDCQGWWEAAIGVDVIALLLVVGVIIRLLQYYAKCCLPDTNDENNKTVSR